ncbi:MAG: RluA family pseudouridine synthase [Balneolales bacterium]|nr:RluA family pseudouridine synthase [Balneolales bacterium]
MKAPTPPAHIIFEDNHLLVVHKPANMPAQEDSSGDMDLLTSLKNFIKERDEKPGNVFLGLVHRLDRPTQGVMVFAKTSKAASRLSDQFRKRTIKKIYHAVVEGQTEAEETLTHFLEKDRETNIVKSVDSGRPDAKKAILHYRRIGSAADYTLLEIELETGRSHQVRVQCAAQGFPLVGDVKYGNTDTPKTRKAGLSLIALKLGLHHPTKNEWMEFAATTPESWPWSLF